MQKPDKIISALLHWFERNARDLPWRRTRDPYAIWVSEVMLQQTQVKTVIPYFERWMQTVPTVSALALLPEQQLLKLWEGLGYYSRARNLQKAARQVLEKFEGRIPSKVEELLELPGIGPYTAGAIASLAFNEPAPIVDGNVIRVLARLLGIDRDPKQKEVNRLFWEHAGNFVRRAAENHQSGPRAAGTFNESLMELGAVICTPQQPACSSCPVHQYCFARQHRCVERLPSLPRRAPQTNRTFVGCVFSRGNKVLVRQRPAQVVNGGLWEFPNLEVSAGNSISRMLAGLTLGIPAQKFLAVKHTITRYRLTLQMFRAEVRDVTFARRLAGVLNAKWVATEKLEKLPLSSAHARIRVAILNLG